MTASEDAAVSNAGDRISQSFDGRRFQNISIWTISCAARCDPERTMQMKDEVGAPKIVDRRTFQAELDALRVREKAHTREGDAIAAARRRLSMVQVDGGTPLIGKRGAVTLLDTFEGRRMLIAYYFMWDTGSPAPEQCEGCTFFTSQVRELSYIHSRDVTFAVLCQGPYEESARYRDFMGWEMPWYSAKDSLDILLVGRRVGMMHIVCYLRQKSNVFETYWTTVRGVEAMDSARKCLSHSVVGGQARWGVPFSGTAYPWASISSGLKQISRSRTRGLPARWRICMLRQVAWSQR